MTVKKIVLDDIPLILGMLSKMHEESPVYREHKYDPVQSAAALRYWIESGLNIGVIDTYKGVLLAVQNSTWYGPNLLGAELMLYVCPEYRGGLLGVKLITAFQHEARRQNCKILHVGSSAGIDDESVRDLYIAMGFKVSGYVLSKTLDV